MNSCESNEQTQTAGSERKWNKLWDLYGSGELAESDFTAYAVCEYESGVNGEGHSGWFFNTENSEGAEAISKLLSALESVLPGHLYDNLNKAFLSFGTEAEEDVCETADDYFYQHEKEIIEYLQGVADRMEL